MCFQRRGGGINSTYMPVNVACHTGGFKSCVSTDFGHDDRPVPSSSNPSFAYLQHVCVVSSSIRDCPY